MAIASASSYAQSFTGLGDLPGGSFESYAFGVSSDGTVVVGASISGSGPQAFRWTAAGGMRGLGELPGGSFFSFAYGVNGNGSVVVGDSIVASGFSAFRWTAATGMQSLGDLPGGQFNSEARAVSADGTVVVGRSLSASGYEAFRWTAADGLQGLGDLSGGNFESRTFGISGDGLVAVGWGSSTSGREAFRWSAGEGMRRLGVSQSSAYGVAGDGSVVVGSGLSAVGTEAFRWTAGDEFQWLGDLPGGSFESVARGVSEDGLVVVGTSISASGSEAFLWTPALGMVNLRHHLIAQGVTNLAGWSLYGVYAISADGSTIVGEGGNPQGQSEAWAATLCIDEDMDGLCDDWEVNGIPYTDAAGIPQRYILDANGDGVSDAIPVRKDLFVEIDAMQGLAPSQAVLNRVVQAFDRAPVPAPSGVPGGLPHVSLHLQIDPAHLALSLLNDGHYVNGDGGFADFQFDKDRYFGTVIERADVKNWARIKEAKARAYRYCIFANTHGGGTSSGLAEGIVCNDFMVTLGPFSSQSLPDGVLDDAQAGTFMHELGHTLGLQHGGDQGSDNRTEDFRWNYKPNYFSVMNYMWQFPSSYMSGGPGPVGRWLRYFPNYSENALPTLEETRLDESMGIGGNFAGVDVPYSIPAGAINCDGGLICTSLPSRECIRYARFQGPVDWNFDCVQPFTPATVAADINFIDVLGGSPSPNPGDELRGFDDWANLRYDFKGSPHFMAGAPVNPPPPCPDLNTFLFLNWLPPPPEACAPDFNADGVANSQDFFDFLIAFFVQAQTADFNSDGAVNSQDFFDFLTAFFAGC